VRERESKTCFFFKPKPDFRERKFFIFLKAQRRKPKSLVLLSKAPHFYSNPSTRVLFQGQVQSISPKEEV
jgi:hypothetical protein